MGLIPVSINIEKFVFDIDSLSNYSFSEKRKIYRRKRQYKNVCIT